MDFAELAALASGHAEARAIQTALKLGIFEMLERSPLDDAALAAAISANRRATALIANAMVALGLLDKRADRYSLTEAVAALPAALVRRISWRLDSVRRGNLSNLDASRADYSHRPARASDRYVSKPSRRDRTIHPRDGQPHSRARRSGLRRQPARSEQGLEVADLGGGPGTYTVALLRRWPHLRAAIYDLPATLEVARKILAEREPAALERIDLVRVDYLYDEIPGPCGALFMSNIIHSEDETDNAQLFRKCFRALESGGMMIIKDHIMNADLTEPQAGRDFRALLASDHARARLFI